MANTCAFDRRRIGKWRIASGAINCPFTGKYSVWLFGHAQCIYYAKMYSEFEIRKDMTSFISVSFNRGLARLNGVYAYSQFPLMVPPTTDNE